MKIADREISEKVFIVAEMGASHCRCFHKAIDLVYAAKKAGADAVKIQVFSPDALTLKSNKSHFWMDTGLWHNRTLYGLYEKCAFPYEWVHLLKGLAEEIGIILFPSVYDDESLEVVGDMPAYKIASYEAVDTEFVKKVAEKGRPLLISCGCLSFTDMHRVRRALGKTERIWLKCTSNYPTEYSNVNLRTLYDMARSYGRYIGISDHTKGIFVPITSVACGAVVIEKHICLDNESPDEAFALRPQEFKNMVEGVRAAEQSLGAVIYGRNGDYARYVGRNLVAIEEIKKGGSLAGKVRLLRTTMAGTRTAETAQRDYSYGDLIEKE